MQETQTETPEKNKIASNGVIAMMMFVGCEIMYFLALVSAYLIVSQGQLKWPPPDQPRLPVGLTAFNTVVLMVSGLLMYMSNKQFKAGAKKKATNLLFLSVLAATFFVCIQGYEWISLIYSGLTMFSSSYGSFFYLVVGSHAVHAFIAIIVMFVIFFKMKNGTASAVAFNTSQVFWYFVVGIWPILYVTVYLI